MIVGLHHIGLTVTDAERSAEWYERILGFTRVGGHEEPGGRKKVFLAHPGLSLRLGLVQHADADAKPFNETATGLDHLAFTVSADVLADWTTTFQTAGITYSPVAPSAGVPGATLVVFRDPDNIQLEVFAPPAA